MNLDGAVIVDLDPHSGFAGSGFYLQRAVDAGILYVCPVNDGTCPLGHHQGGVVLHYCEGKDIDDFGRVLSRGNGGEAEGRE